MSTQRKKVCAALIMACLPLVSMAETVPYVAQQAIPTAPCTGNVCYDTQGDLVRDNSMNQYTYNGLSQLTTTTPKTTNKAITYTYFPNGQLANVSNGVTNITHYYTRNNQVFDSVANNGNQASYLIANGITSRNATVSGTLTTTAYVQNLKGSIVENVSPTNVASSQYDAYGADIDSTAAIVKPLSIANNPIRYDGYFYEWGSGLYNLGNARDYNVRLRTFMTADSVLIHSDNMYFYGNNDPIDMSDPSGHMAQWKQNYRKFESSWGGMIVNLFGSFIPGWSFMSSWMSGQKISGSTAVNDSIQTGMAALMFVTPAVGFAASKVGASELMTVAEFSDEIDATKPNTFFHDTGQLKNTAGLGKADSKIIDRLAQSNITSHDDLSTQNISDTARRDQGLYARYGNQFNIGDRKLYRYRNQIISESETNENIRSFGRSFSWSIRKTKGLFNTDLSWSGVGRNLAGVASTLGHLGAIGGIAYGAYALANALNTNQPFNSPTNITPIGPSPSPAPGPTPPTPTPPTPPGPGPSPGPGPHPHQPV